MRISDWSSDVCSSDLQVGGDGTDKLYDFSFLRFSDATFDLTGGSGDASPEAQNDTATGAEDSALVIDVLGNDSSPGGGALTVSSEERRVGKECVRTCRSRRSPYPKKNNKLKTT